MDEARCRELLEFGEAVGLAFAPRELDLVNQALTHRSYAVEAGLEAMDNERLEFLGDAVVGLVVTQEVYERYQTATEGELSRIKAAVVSRQTLGWRARDLGIAGVVRLGRGERRPGHDVRLSILGSALEALIGALYLLRGCEPAAQWVRQRVVGPSRQEMSPQHEADHKSRLQEWTQAHLGRLPQYRKVHESGPDHAKTFIVEVEVDGRVVGSGQGHRLKEAENTAARQALDALQEKNASHQE